MSKPNAYSWLPSTVEEYRRWYSEFIPPTVASCTCWCGCDRPVTIARFTNTNNLHFKDEPIRFIHRHKKPLDARFNAENRGYETPCWIWSGHIEQHHGYGVHKIDKKRVKAHRWMYERVHGPALEWPYFHLHHWCGQRACVNPEHLQLMSAAEHSHTFSSTILTADDVRRIRTLLTQGSTYHDLGNVYGLTPGAIEAVDRGYNWRNV